MYARGFVKNNRLFFFFGFLPIALPDELVKAVDSRARRIYYRASAVAQSFDRGSLPSSVDPGAPILSLVF